MFKTRVIYSCDVLQERQRREAFAMIAATTLAVTFVVAFVIAQVRGNEGTSFTFFGIAMFFAGVMSWRASVGMARYRAHYAAVHADADVAGDSHDVTDADR